MKDQVVMSKMNAELAVAVPLFRLAASDDLGSLDGYSLMVSNSKPIAYVLCVGDVNQILNAKFVEENCEFLSEL